MNNDSLTTHWASLIGSTLGTTDWLEIDQAKIDAFADVTSDHQVIHVDPDAFATKELGGTIAHGFLGLSMLSYLSHGLLEPHINNNVVLNYGLNRVRFITPIPASSKIRLTATVITTEAKSQGVLVTYQSQVDIDQHEKPAFVAEQLILIMYQNNNKNQGNTDAI